MRKAHHLKDVGEKEVPSRSEQPKLTVCLASLAPFVGGADVAAERLALGLGEAGHEVFLLLGKRGSVMQRMEQAGLRCIHSPMYLTDKWHWWRYVRARNACCRVLKQEKPCIVHSNDLPTHQMVSDAARRVGIARVCHHRFFFGGSAIDWLNKYGAERHLFVSQALMGEMCAQSSQLTSSSRAVVYDGLHLPSPVSQDHRLRFRQSLELPSDKVIITFTGQIIERKGVADLLRAWATLVPSYADRAELVIVGDDLQTAGQYRQAMHELAKELDCRPRFVGFQKNVDQWLAASDIAVVPSLVEPLGNATLEAMAWSLPVVGCNVGGIPEMIVHEQTGLLVEPRRPDQLAAALVRLLEDDKLRRTFGEQGRLQCESRFSLQVHVQNVLQEYQVVLERSGC